MFRKGTRVVVVDAREARKMGAEVSDGEKGTVGKPASDPEYVRVHMDGDTSPIPWSMPTSCVKRIRKQRRSNEN